MTDKKISNGIMGAYSTGKISGNTPQSATVRVKPQDMARRLGQIDGLFDRLNELEAQVYGEVITDKEITMDSMPAMSRAALRQLREGKDAVMDASSHAVLLANMDDIVQGVGERARTLEKEAAKIIAMQRFAHVAVKTEKGEVFVEGYKMRLLVGRVVLGMSTLIEGAPGVGKTDIMRSLSNLPGIRYFHLNATGMSEPGDIEYRTNVVSTENGPEMQHIPTPLMEALEYIAMDPDNKAVVGWDEILRQPPEITNPVLSLLAEGEFRSNVTGKVYRPAPGQFTLVATANRADGYSFSGNTRRGMDAALEDRFGEPVVFLPPPAEFMNRILSARIGDGSVPMPCGFLDLEAVMKSVRKHASPEKVDAVSKLYAATQGDAKLRQHFTVRRCVRLGSDWNILGDDWELGDVIERTNTHLLPEEVASIQQTLRAHGL